MDYLFDYLVFLAKSVKLISPLLVLGLVMVIITAAKQKARKGELELQDLTAHYEETKSS